MAGWTTYTRGKLTAEVFTNVNYAPPAAVYMALFTTDPGDAGVLSGELTGGSYARTACTWTVAADGSVSLAADCVFPQASANWVDVYFIGICDANAAGNVLLVIPLVAKLSVKNLQNARFVAGSCYFKP